MGSCVYVAALDDSARPSRPSSSTTTVCHALRSTDARVVCFEILRGGGAPESFQRGASGRWRGQNDAVVLASFVVAPMSGSRRRGS